MAKMECQKCHADNPEGKKFCGDCGAEFTSGEMKEEAPETDLRDQVESILNEKYKDQRIIEVELVEKIANRLLGWAKLFASFVGIPLSVLALVLGILGIKTTFDYAALNDRFTQIKKEGDELASDLSKAKEQRDRINKIAADLQTVTTKVESIEEKISPDASLNSNPKGKNIISALTDFQKYFKKIGFTPPKSELKVSKSSDKDNTYYAYQENHLFIGENLADDLDIVYEEYSHRALAETNKEFWDSASYKLNAIEAGLADYYACSYTDDPSFAEKSAPIFQKKFGVELHGPGLRNLNNERKFSEVKGDPISTEIHTVGEIWGGAFWDMRNLMTKDNADKLLFLAWAALGSSANHGGDINLEFVNRILEKDQAINNGENVDQIKSIFQRRGLGV